VKQPVEVISTTSLADEIAFRLQASILDGTYPPGTHLFQDEVCERFGVSRTPVREALRKLQAWHLVVLVPNKGATVRVPSRVELIDVYVLRAELEGFACELACAHVTDQMLAELGRAQEDVNKAVDRIEHGGVGPDDAPSLDALVSRSNEEFHGIIARAAGNVPLCKIIADLQGFFPKDYVWRAMSSATEVRSLNIEEHERICDGLRARRPALARKEMRSHITHASRILLEYLDAHDFWQ
jgi:DNA-binding GntR family transcriptional regulator